MEFITMGVVVSFLTAIYAFIKGRNAPATDLCPGATGSFFNDFVVGRELNPRLFNLDLKLTMVRCGLLSWMFIIWCLTFSQYKAAGSVKEAMVVLTLCQTVYLAAIIRNEEFMLTSLDFRVEGYGLMFILANLTLFPYIYTLQSRFLFNFPEAGLSNPYALASVLILNVVGLVIFRGSMVQKHEFRTNPYSPALVHLTSIPTTQGKRLLCSGYWGICRRPNYLGDLMVALSWSLICGFNYVIPYLYPAFLLALLVHRVLKDEAELKKKYGAAWDRYTDVVKYRIVPYVF